MVARNQCIVVSFIRGAFLHIFGKIKKKQNTEVQMNLLKKYEQLNNIDLKFKEQIYLIKSFLERDGNLGLTNNVKKKVLQQVDTNHIIKKIITKFIFFLSTTKDKKHKVVTILGMKFKFRIKKKAKNEKFGRKL